MFGGEGGSLQDCTDNVVIAGALGVGIRGDAKDLINLSDGLKLSFGSHGEARSFDRDGSITAWTMCYDDYEPADEGLQNLTTTISLGNNPSSGVNYFTTGQKTRLKPAKRSGRTVSMAVSGLDPEAMYLLEVRGRKTMYFLFSTARYTSDVACLNN